MQNEASGFVYNPNVKAAILESIKQIRGLENKEDAMQEAYSSVLCENPNTEVEAVDIATRAIDRFRKKIIKTAKMERALQENTHGGTGYEEWRESWYVYENGVYPDEYSNDIRDIYPEFKDGFNWSSPFEKYDNRLPVVDPGVKHKRLIRPILER